MGDYDWLAPLLTGVAKGATDIGTGLQANAQTQAALDEMLRNWKERMGDYDAIGDAGYKDVSPVLLGDTALAGIPQDAAGRQAQQEAMAALSELAQNGGLSLGDLKTLNDIQASLSRTDQSRRKGLANDFAARGQLGAGAQLAMALQGQQDAAMQANAAGESAAAQGQARALQALLEKGRMGRTMGNDQYARDAEAAKARDAIAARNAAARMGSMTANNAIAGQRFDDQMAKAHGKTSLTNSMNEAVFNKGAANKNTTKAMGGYANDLIDTGATAFSSFGRPASSGTDEIDVSADHDDEESEH